MKPNQIFQFGLVCISFATIPASAYQTPTHSEITKNAIGASKLDTRLADIASDIGLSSLDSTLSDGGEYFFGAYIFENSQSISDWIRQGSIDEDSFQGLRFLRHFYNPLAPAGREGLYGGTFLSSLAWGLKPTPGITDPVVQDFSYRNARTYFYQGLVAPSERERKKNLSLMFRSVGQVMHLLQDLAQPQHTRDDSHATFPRYEKDTNKIRGLLPYSGYPVVSVSTPDQFWVTPIGGGMANYSNRGFVTDGTNLKGSRSGNTLNIQPSPNFPSPNGLGAMILKKQITDPDLLGAVSPTQTLQGEIWFISTTVSDSDLPSLTAVNPKTSTFSIFDEDLSAIGSDWTFTLNTFNFREAQRLLIPRAVGYSAGLIDYFFRGTMEIMPPDEKVYGIVDHSTIHQTDPLVGYVGFDTIKLKLRNTTPNEDMSGGTLVAVAKFHRNGCYKDDLTGEFTQDRTGAFQNPVCASGQSYRTNAEDIVVSTPIQGVNLPAGTMMQPSTPQPYTFAFPTQIPINATDLYIQVVYKGALGKEENAVAVATKDVFEPTYLTWYNSTDQIWVNGTFYSTTGSTLLTAFPALAGPDHLLAPQFKETNLDVNFNFTGSNSAFLGTVSALPPGRFSRLALLTDSNPFTTVSIGSNNALFYSGFVFQLSPEFNQVDSSNRYHVSAFRSIRGINSWDPLSFFRTLGTGTFDVRDMAQILNVAPYPVTNLSFKP